MTQQLELIQPSSVVVAGVQLAETISQLESSGALVTALELVGRCNGSYRLELCWPQIQPEREP